MPSIVSVARCDSYDEEKVYDSVKRALANLGGIGKFVRKGDKVLLKPNLLAPHAPEKAVTTHPSVVKAVARLVMEAGGIVSIGDSPAIGSTEKSATAAGISEVCRQTGALLADFSEPGEKPSPRGEMVKRFELAKPVIQADVIINLPKYKTHVFTLYTGAVKNLFGCIPGLRKSEFHLKFHDYNDFSNMLLDLYLCVKPQLSIMDGIVAMEGPGPQAGTPKKAGIISASADAVALDSVMCRLAGIPLEKVPVLVNAERRKIGETKRFSVLGDDTNDMHLRFRYEQGHSMFTRLPRWMYRFMRSAIIPRPKIGDGCVACGMCARNCPAKAITVKDRAVISYRKCISCFCCQEICPKKVIKVYYPPGARIFSKIRRLAE